MRWFGLLLGIVAGLLVASLGQVFAQEAGGGVMTVDEVVARALADNPDLRAVRAEVDAAVGRLRQAGLRPNPMLELGGQKAISPDSNLSVGVTLPLDLNGRVDGRVGVAQRELEMRRAQVAERERRLAAEVRLKAGELLAGRRNVEVTDELLRINREALRLVGDRVREGAAPPLEENLLLVEVNRLDASRQMLDSRVTVLTLQLKALVGLEPDASLTLRGELAGASPAVTRAEAVAAALSRRPDLEVARADTAMARARIRKEEAEGRWDASVSVGYQRQDFGFSGLRGVASNGSLQPIQDVFHYFGAGVSITLPVRNRNQGNVTAAAAEARAAERRQEFAVLVIRQEVEAAFAQLEAARRALALYERGVRDVAQRNLEVVRRTWELGRGTLLDVITEQRRLIEVENGYTDALRQTYDAAVEIDRAVGLTTTAPRG
jgi:cobalt-zinc-cadmium efflux system outer membrane protein